MKAMILAAGLGERMRPLTEKTPKPLLKVGDKSLIEYHVCALRDAGIKDIVINVSHLARQIMAALGDGTQYGVSITYSVEDNGPHGTGHGIFQALPLLGDQPFVLLSADIWTQYPYDSLLKKPIDEVHLVMVENPSYCPKGDFGLSPSHQVTQGEPKYTYGNIAIVHPKLFSGVNDATVPAHIAVLFREAIARGTVTGELYTGAWDNIGTPAQLRALQKTIE